MTSSTNERQIKARNAQAKRDRVGDEIVTKTLMLTPDGRRWVWLRLSEGRLFDRADGPSDHAQMSFDFGLRQAALRLLKDVQMWCPTEYIQMTNEAQAIEASILNKEPNYVGSPDDTE